MSSNISSIKTRIKSINSTKKITNSMKSVSTVKLNRMSRVTLSNREYKNELEDCCSYVLNSTNDLKSKYTSLNKSNKKIYIVFCSDLGLCGSYNTSIYHYIEQNVDINDSIYLVGLSIYNLLSKSKYKIINKPIASDNVEYYDLVNIFYKISNDFLNSNVSEVKVIYSKFINTVSYNIEEFKLLPFSSNHNNKSKEIILEPNPNIIIDNLIELSIKNQIYSLFLESKTSEQVARRFAMDNATSNADDLVNELVLEYNKARQASITQEITEIVAGANAI